MRKICEGFIVVAAISLILGVISRLIVKPLLLGIEAQAFLQFTQACLLFAIAIAVREWMIAKGK